MYWACVDVGDSRWLRRRFYPRKMTPGSAGLMREEVTEFTCLAGCEQVEPVTLKLDVPLCGRRRGDVESLISDRAVLQLPGQYTPDHDRHVLGIEWGPAMRGTLPSPPISVQAGEMTDQRSPRQGEGPDTVPSTMHHLERGDPARTPQKACQHRSEHARSRGPDLLSMEARHLVSLTRPQGDRGRKATDVGISRSHRNFDLSNSKPLGRPNRVSIHPELQQSCSV